jgi:hypothetical protein
VRANAANTATMATMARFLMQKSQMRPINNAKIIPKCGKGTVEGAGSPEGIRDAERVRRKFFERHLEIWI